MFNHQNAMNERSNLSWLDPKAFEAMLCLEKYLTECDLDKVLLELIKTRASQMNGCAYCINMHTQDAIGIGETAQRLFLLNAWRETDLFTKKEKAVLELTEAMTLIADRSVSDEVYDAARAHLTDKEMAAALLAIVTINGWNRIAITLRTPLDHSSAS